MAFRQRILRSVWLRIIASTALLLLCLNLIQPAELIEALDRIKLSYFLAAFLLNACGTVLVRAWVANMTTHASGLTLSYGELVQINLIARFYTLALPRGASAAIRWQRYRAGGSGYAAAALLLFENLVSIFTLFLTAAFILMFEVNQAGTVARVLLPLTWLGTLAMIISLLPFLHKPSAALALRLLQPLLQRPGRLSDIAGRLLAAITAYRTISTRRVGTIFFASLVGYIFFVLSAWVLAEGMMLGVTLAAIAWIRSVTLLVALVPITVAGIGLREGAFIALLHDYGVAPSEAFAYAMVAFVIQLVLGLFGALLETRRVLCRIGKNPATNLKDTSL